MSRRISRPGAPAAPPTPRRQGPARRPQAPRPAHAPPARDGWTGPDGRPAPPPPAPQPAGTAATGSPLPAATFKVLNGVTIEAYGASPAAQAEAEAVVTRVAARADLQQAMLRQRVTLVIIPVGVKMTDLPEFASLKGKKTFDGRPWEEVRGSGGMRLPDRRLVVGIPEENLAKLPTDPYQGKYSVAMHELAHALQNDCLPVDEAHAITQAYEAHQAAGGPWTEAYGSSNEMEYFAQGTNAWFGRNERVGNNGADWVRTHDPALAAILQKVYGDPT